MDLHEITGRSPCRSLSARCADPLRDQLSRRRSGHPSVQVTLDLYSHLMPDLSLKEPAAARLDAVLTPAEN